MRIDKRETDEMRPVRITRNYLKYAEGSALIEVGNTRVLCAATIEDRVPPFMKGSGEGWVTAEYSLLPRSTQTRNHRESAKGKVTGRTHEIQRLIGRSLRSVVDLKALGERTIWIDCDVIQADGGTRTASITGAFVAMTDAIASIYKEDKPFPVKDFVAAVSVGIHDNTPMLDLCYAEDSNAEVDMNFVITGEGKFVEIQGTGEERPFDKKEMATMTALAEKGVAELIEYQKDLLGREAWNIGREP